MDNYKEVEKIARDADNKSKTNEKRIDALEDRNKWLARTMIGAILCEIVGIGFMLMQAGLGAN